MTIRQTIKGSRRVSYRILDMRMSKIILSESGSPFREVFVDRYTIGRHQYFFLEPLKFLLAEGIGLVVPHVSLNKKRSLLRGLKKSRSVEEWSHIE